jgi:hypothetical protein
MPPVMAPAPTTPSTYIAAGSATWAHDRAAPGAGGAVLTLNRAMRVDACITPSFLQARIRSRPSSWFPTAPVRVWSVCRSLEDKGRGENQRDTTQRRMWRDLAHLLKSWELLRVPVTYAYDWALLSCQPRQFLRNTQYTSATLPLTALGITPTVGFGTSDSILNDGGVSLVQCKTESTLPDP